MRTELDEVVAEAESARAEVDDALAVAATELAQVTSRSRDVQWKMQEDIEMLRFSLHEEMRQRSVDAQTAEAIARTGFNRSFAGKNATRYGKGVYFHRDSGYSVGYAKASDRDELQSIFLCKVLVGEYGQGERDCAAPPWRSQQEHLRFDSTVDNLQKPVIYVTYHDAQVYPDYLIRFRLRRPR